MSDADPNDNEEHPSPLPKLRPPSPLRRRLKSDASAASSRSSAPSAAPSRRSDGRGDIGRESDERVVGEYVDKRNFLIKQRSVYRVRAEGDNSGEVRAQEVFVRNEDATEAMSREKRYKQRCERIFCWWKEEEEKECKEGDIEEGAKKPQFNLTATRVVEHFWKEPLRAVYNFLLCGSASISAGDSNQLLINFMYFMFRCSFFVLVLISAVAFYTLCVIFAGLILSAGRLDPTCFVIGGNVGFPGADGTELTDAFSLSWTTFSTVGYGSYGPNTGANTDNHSNCAYLTVILAIESFVGVLFSGFVGAILFGKVVRIQSHAQVEFSQPIVIRYGGGVHAQDVEEDDDEDDVKGSVPLEGDTFSGSLSKSGAVEEAATRLQAAFRGVSVRMGKKVQRIPCPVLEFRIANRLHDEVGGEIMDAVLNVVANQDAAEADPVLRDKLDEARVHWLKSIANKDRGGGLRVSTISRGTTNSPPTSSNAGARTDATSSSDKTVKFSHNLASSVSSSPNAAASLTKSAIQHVVGDYMKKDHTSIEEDPTSLLVPKRIFSKLLIEASEHPYFKRVWLARHIVNDTSPLLTPKVRRLIRKNHGFWPESLNSYQGVKDSIQVNQILVSLVGVSNISGSEVYAQKVYDSVDCVVGYQFVNVLYKGADESLKVDMDLLNDVREQNNGGGEPLIDLGE